MDTGKFCQSCFLPKFCFVLVVHAVEIDFVAGNVTGNEKWKSLDVIPMQMTQEDVNDLQARAVGHHRISHTSQTATGIDDQDFVIAVIDRGAAGVTAVGAANMKGKLIAERLDIIRCVGITIVCQRRDHLIMDKRGRDWRRYRSASAPRDLRASRGGQPL